MLVQFFSWVPVAGFEEKYYISKRGTIRSVNNNTYYKDIKVRKDRSGYLTVRLSKNGQNHTCFIHRLVATAFVPNPGKRSIVNHINGNKLDNRPENLEWTDHAGNIAHAYSLGLISKQKKMKVVIDRCSGRRFESVKEAAAFYMIPYSTCKNYLNGNRPNITCLQYEEKEAA